MSKLIVQAPSQRATQAKWQRHTGKSDTQCYLPVADEEAKIDLEADEEEKQHQTKIRDKCQIWHGGGGKDCRREAWYPAHDGGTEKNATNDFGDDARLAKL